MLATRIAEPGVGSQWGVLMLYVTAGLCILLHNIVHQCLSIPGSSPRSRTTLFAVEFLSLVAPMVLVQSALAQHIYWLITALISIIALLVIRNWRKKFGLRYRSLSRLWSQSLTDVESEQAVRNSILAFRALVLITTTIAISAVDFPVFPASFMKSVRYGHTVMDTGTGAFVFVNALADYSAAELEKSGGIARKRRTTISNVSSTTYRSIFSVRIPALLLLFIVGVARMVFVWLTGYSHDEKEYGLHWNFFFTLFVLRLYVQLVSYPFSILVGLAIGLTYQIALSTTGLEQWLLRGEGALPRSGLVDENREGLFSALGYIFLYSLSLVYAKISIGLVTSPSTSSVKDRLRLRPIMAGLALALVAFGIQLVLELFNVSRASRRIANAGYAFAMLALFQISLSGLQLFNYFVQHPPSSTLMSAISQNGLLYFLFANFLTAAIKVSIPSLAAMGVSGTFPETLVIMLYSLSLALFAQFIDTGRQRGRLEKAEISMLIMDSTIRP